MRENGANTPPLPTSVHRCEDTRPRHLCSQEGARDGEDGEEVCTRWYQPPCTSTPPPVPLSHALTLFPFPSPPLQRVAG